MYIFFNRFRQLDNRFFWSFKLMELLLQEGAMGHGFVNKSCIQLWKNPWETMAHICSTQSWTFWISDTPPKTNMKPSWNRFKCPFGKGNSLKKNINFGVNHVSSFFWVYCFWWGFSSPKKISLLWSESFYFQSHPQDFSDPKIHTLMVFFLQLGPLKRNVSKQSSYFFGPPYYLYRWIFPSHGSKNWC